ALRSCQLTPKRIHTMPTLAQQIERSRRDALVALAEADSGAALEEWSIKHLGKKGQMTGLFRGVGALPPEERATAGQAINAAKQELEEAYAQARERITSVERTRRLQEEAVDITLPG